MKVVFVHGGPGLNSNPELNILKDDFLKNDFDIFFWNEPRVFSSQNYYDEILDSLVQFIHSLESSSIVLVGHSFGCNLILNIMPLVKEKIHSLCFLSPALDLSEVDNNIIEYGLNLLKHSDLESASKLQATMAKMTKKFDKTKIEALMLAMSSDLFHHYFANEESFSKYFHYLEGENVFRIDDYVTIRQSQPLAISKSDETFTIPLLAIFGKNDPVCNPDYEEKVLSKYFSNMTLHILENIAHYPHIDAKDFFFEKLKAHI